MISTVSDKFTHGYTLSIYCEPENKLRAREITQFLRLMGRIFDTKGWIFDERVPLSEKKSKPCCYDGGSLTNTHALR